MLAAQNYTPEKLENHLHSGPAHALLRKWAEWRGAEIAPKRSQIRIEGLGEALPFVTMGEFVSPEELRFLLVGSELINIQGMELTGMNFYDMAQPDERELRMQRLRWFESQPCGSYSIQPRTLSQGTHLASELLALPVLPDEPDGTLRCLCVSAPLDDGAFRTSLADAQVIRTSDDFRYIDIGAGLPDEDPKLGCQAPLTLL